MRIKLITAILASITVVGLCIFCAAYFGIGVLVKPKNEKSSAESSHKKDEESDVAGCGMDVNRMTSIYANSSRDSSEEPDVAGWGRNVSRNASIYVNPFRDSSFSHMDPDICSKKKPLVVIIVCSNIINEQRRQTIRNTWAKDVHLYNILLIFLLGFSLEKKVNIDATQESITHKDIIFEDVVEAYFNLTIKSIFMLKWAHKRCRQARFLFKTDDDSYVNLTNLYNYTMHIPEYEMGNFLVGRMAERHWRIPHREPESKWYVPKYIFPEDYPPYLMGIGYLMSIQVAEKLYFESLRTTMFYIEDVYITGILPKKINVTIKDELLCRPACGNTRVNITCNSHESRLIVVEHGSDVERMHEIYQILNKC